MHTIDFIPSLPTEQIVEASNIQIQLPEPPTRYYRHGWQSWSLTTWMDTSRNLPISRPHLFHPMQHDPLHVLHTGHHGSWVGAVEMEPGKVLLLGSLGLDAHVALDGSNLLGTYDAGSGAWFIAHGKEVDVFARYAAALGERFGARAKGPAPRVWCSWYSLYTAITEPLLGRIFTELGDLPFDLLQVDDGWQQKIGDWEPNAKFPAGMQALADSIHATGRRAGLWLAPLIAVRSSRLFRQHPDWFLHQDTGALVSAGFNWGEQLYALDTTHPAALDWLRSLMKQVRAWGYDYLKLDFLYAGALPGKRYADVPREQAYRQGLQAMRDAMGNDAFLLGCGAPILPSLGICDALRVGPDVAAEWELGHAALIPPNPAVPGVRNAIRTTLHRLWLKPLLHPDPDVVYFRSVECSLTPEQKKLLQALALLCGFKATSDLPQWLTQAERSELRAFLTTTPSIEQTGARDFLLGGAMLDYSSAMQLAEAPTGWQPAKHAFFGWLAEHGWALRIDTWLGQRALARQVRALEK